MNASSSQPQLTGTGYLIVHVTTARGAIPLEGALVTIRDYEADEENGGTLVSSLVSGADGNTELLALKTHPRSESLTSGNPKPYSTYVAEVRLEGFSDQTFIGIPIFDGIVAIQPVDLIPLPEQSGALPSSPENNRFFENVENDL
ncbi:MAG: hypothetical protein IJX28_00805 [Clostridia bacterium]|nr:hypothetical protein [Clostridia bacterium]